MTDIDLDTPIWGTAGIAKAINRSERATQHLIDTRRIDTSKVGGRHTSTLRRLRISLGIMERRDEQRQSARE